MSLKEFIDHLKSEEGQVIRKAPFAFATTVLVFGVIIFLAIGWIEQWHYGGTISKLTATNELLSEQKTKSDGQLLVAEKKLESANQQIANLLLGVSTINSQIDTNSAEALRKFIGYAKDPYQLSYWGQDYGYNRKPKTAVYFLAAAEEVANKSNFDDANNWKEFRACYARDLFICGRVSDANAQLDALFMDCTNAIAHPGDQLSSKLFLNGKLHPSIIRRIENMEEYVRAARPECLEYAEKFRQKMDRNFSQ